MDSDVAIFVESDPVFAGWKTTFIALVSKELNPDNCTYFWDLDDKHDTDYNDNYTDDTDATGRSVVHTFLNIRTYVITLTVRTGSQPSALYRATMAVSVVLHEKLDNPPVANLSYEPAEPKPNQVILFNATSSYDVDINDTIKEYKFDFGDGYDTGWTTKPVKKYSYNKPGHYNVSLLVKDKYGNVSSPFYVLIEVNEPDQGMFVFTKDMVSAVFLFLGIVLLLGFIGNIMFKKFGIPDILILFLLGILASILLRYVDIVNTDLFFSIAPLVGGIALMVLLFEGGLQLPMDKVIKGTPRAALLGVSGVILSVAIVTAIAGALLFKGNMLLGMLLGGVVGGTSSAIILSMVTKIDIEDYIKTRLSVESTISDVLCIVVVISIAEYLSPIGTMGTGPMGVIIFILQSFVVGILVGAVSGLAWIWLFKKILHIEYSFMLLFAILIIIYALSEIIGGSGPISALIFGLILSNGKKIGDLINKVVHIEPTIEIPADMKKFQSEISFFIKSFFFVFLGLLISPRLLPTTFNSIKLWLIGLAIVAGLMIARYIAVRVSQIKSNESSLSTRMMTTILPRGLTAAVLATTPLTYKLAERSDISKAYLTNFTDITFIVIITTVLITTIGVPIINKRIKTSDKDPHAKEDPDTAKVAAIKDKNLEKIPLKEKNRRKKQKNQNENIQQEPPKPTSAEEKN